MEHDWQIELVEYYDMDSDWVCQKCQARVRREFPRNPYGGMRDTRETLEEFKMRLESLWEAWRKIPKECLGK